MDKEHYDEIRRQTITMLNDLDKAVKKWDKILGEGYDKSVEDFKKFWFEKHGKPYPHDNERYLRISIKPLVDKEKLEKNESRRRALARQLSDKMEYMYRELNKDDYSVFFEEMSKINECALNMVMRFSCAHEY